FDVRVLHKDKDIFRTASCEYIVSQKFFDTVEKFGLTGAEFKPVIHKGRTKKVLNMYYQMIIHGTVGKSVPPTKFGCSPFSSSEENQEDVCPLGHISGINLLSELYINRENHDKSDICITEDCIGSYFGLHIPYEMIVVSRKCYEVFKAEKIRGLAYDVAHTLQG
ncbi:MAG: hypothetical protein LWY06_14550, partial [Firmicutes bacterium]|nr:hypothetical protein [Bacillota bacterium]